jgi:hypothetical protein
LDVERVGQVGDDLTAAEPAVLAVEVTEVVTAHGGRAAAAVGAEEVLALLPFGGWCRLAGDIHGYVPPFFFGKRDD